MEMWQRADEDLRNLVRKFKEARQYMEPSYYFEKFGLYGQWLAMQSFEEGVP